MELNLNRTILYDFNFIYPGKITAFPLLLVLIVSGIANSQCTQNYDWAVWDDFSGNSATGTIHSNGQIIDVTMTANYQFGASTSIFNYGAFSGFDDTIPNSTLPETTWSFGTGGVTMMCFSETVANPVLLLASIGRTGIPVRLQFSRAYKAIYTGYQVQYVNDTTIIGEEGYTILMFPGDFDCVTIYSSTPEYYTNITWGLNPPLFPVSITGDLTACNNTTLTATGGSSYIWSGGDNPVSASNTFHQSGNYFLTVTDENGCTVVTSRQVSVHTVPSGFLGGDTTICDQTEHHLNTGTENTLWFDYSAGSSKIISTSGVYWATVDSNGCKNSDTISIQFNIGNKIFVPDIFSPNNDGINDSFLPYFSDSGLLSYKFSIFNRWGDLLFATNDLDGGGWNGEFKGKACNPDVYVYLIEAKAAHCSNIRLKGGFNLIK